MFRFVAFLILIIATVAAYAWYSAQSLPTWFEDDTSQEDKAAEALNESIKKKGVSRFLGDKVGQVFNGKVSFDETEFNAIMLASLKSHQDGQKLLAVSDAVKAFLHEDEIEISAIINLDKLEKVEPRAREAVEKFDKFFFFLKDSKVALTVYGTPIARNGGIAIRDDFHIKVGAIPISNSSLRQLGAKVEQANEKVLPIKYLSVSDVTLRDGGLDLAVLPRF